MLFVSRIIVLIIITSSIPILAVAAALPVTFNCTRLDAPWQKFPGLCRVFEANFNETTEIEFEPGIVDLSEAYELIFMRSRPGFIPSAVFAKIPNLVGLEAQFCEVRSFPSFALAKNLRKLDLKENFIVEIYRDSFDGANNLTSVDLFRNQVAHIHPEAFYWLPDLEHVLLAHNRLHAIDKHLLSRQAKLKTVDLRHNQLIRFEMVVYVIQRLDLSNNFIKNVTLEATIDDDFYADDCEIAATSNEIRKFQVIGDLTVEKLLLGRNQLTVMENIQLSRPKKVTHLDVSSNPFVVISKPDLAQFSHVEHLNLANTSLKLGEINIFGDLTALTHLNVARNGLRSFDMRILAPKLVAINLDGNELTQLRGLSDLHPREKPFRLSLFNNYFHCDELRRIVRDLAAINGIMVRRGDLIDNQISGFNGIECYE